MNVEGKERCLIAFDSLDYFFGAVSATDNPMRASVINDAFPVEYSICVGAERLFPSTIHEIKWAQLISRRRCDNEVIVIDGSDEEVDKSCTVRKKRKIVWISDWIGDLDMGTWALAD
jgi:hypothetical protein